MKKILILLSIIFVIIIICPQAGLAANIFCECPLAGETPSSECVTPCENRDPGAKICVCENQITFDEGIDGQADCDLLCGNQPQIPEQTPKDYTVCNCQPAVATTYAEGHACYGVCPTVKSVYACVCPNTTVPPHELTSTDGAQAEQECSQSCKEKVPTAAETTPTVPTETQPQLIEQKPPTLYVPLPLKGFELSTIQVAEEGGAQISVPWIAEYIIGIYRYAITIAVILAVVMIMIAGIMYLTSAGNPQRIGQAKNYVIGAIVGLVILASSYLILDLISPELTEFGSIEIESVKTEELEWEESYDEHAQGATAAAIDPEDKIPTERSNCQTTPSKPSGIGNTELLGQLDCNATRQRSLSDIKYIVLHGGSTAKRNVNSWSNNCQAGKYCTASHYTINRSGAIFQTLDERKVGNHAGRWNQAGIGIDLAVNLPTSWTFSRIYTCVEARKTGQYTTKRGEVRKVQVLDKEGAIEYCTPTFTEAQYASLRLLIQNIESRTGASSIKAHCELPVSESSHSDPRNFDWSKIGVSGGHTGPKCKYFPEYADKVREIADKVYGP